MKYILCLLIITSSLFSNLAKSQIVNIPDSVFKAKILQMGWDVNADGEISYEEVVAVDSLNLVPTDFQMPDYSYSDTINDMTGIEAFTALRVLICNENPITSLDLSQNVLLEKLYCDQTKLAGLNLDNNIHLKELSLYGNYELSNVDMTNLVELQYLDISNSAFSSMQFDANVQLKTLNCRRYAGTSIDISPLVNLEYFDCSSSDLLHLDISHNPKLRKVKTDWTLLRTINVAGNDSLLELGVSYGELTTLDVRGAPNLVELDCVLNDLNLLIVTGLPHLKSLNCGLNNLNYLNVSKDTSLYHISCNENNISLIRFYNNYSLNHLYCSQNKLTAFDFDGAPNIKDIECRENSFTDLKIKSESLESFFCSRNPHLTRLDISEAQNIDHLIMYDMPQEIDLCVWSLPFPTTDPYILFGDNGSPNITVKICTDAIEEIPEDQAKIYPNPITEIINIELEKYSDKKTKISIINATGQTVYQSVMSSWKVKTSLPVDGVAKGIYFVKIESGDHVLMKKIIIQ